MCGYELVYVCIWVCVCTCVCVCVCMYVCAYMSLGLVHVVPLKMTKMGVALPKSGHGTKKLRTMVEQNPPSRSPASTSEVNFLPWIHFTAKQWLVSEELHTWTMSFMCNTILYRNSGARKIISTSFGVYITSLSLWVALIRFRSVVPLVERRQCGVVDLLVKFQNVVLMIEFNIIICASRKMCVQHGFVDISVK